MSPARAAVGRVGPVGRCGVAVSRPPSPVIDSRAADRAAASAGWPPQRESASAARARQPCGRVRPQRRAFPRRPERHHGRMPTAEARPQPASRQPVCGHRRGHRHGQHEDQDRGGPRGREVAVDHPGEQDEEPDDEHGRGGEPGTAGARRTHDGQDHAAGRERQVGEEPAAGGPAERDEHQDGQRPERGVQRGLRLADHLVGEREDRGHHDARPGGALERDQAGIVDEGAGYLHPLRLSSGRPSCPELVNAIVYRAMLIAPSGNSRCGPAHGGCGLVRAADGVPFPRPGPYLRVRAPLCCASGGVTTHCGVLGGRPMAAKVGSRP